MHSESEERVLGVFWGYIILVIFVSGLALLAGRGMEDRDNFDKLVFYGVFMLGCASFITLDRLLFRSFDVTFLHEPQKALLGFFEWVKNPVKLFFLSFLAFAPMLFLITFFSKRALVGYTSYQVLEIASLWLAGEPASFAETLMIAVMGGFAYFLAKKWSGKDRTAFVLILITLGLSIVGIMTGYHLWRYANSESNLISVSVFFTGQVLMLFLTGSIIPLAVSHFLSNFCGKLVMLLSNELAVIVAVMLYVVILLIFYATILKKNKRVRNYD